MIKSRQTRQKETLEEQTSKMDSFFTALDLLNKVKNKDKNIGIATVYRFLKDLTKKEKIHSYLCNNKTIYSRNKKSHCHFICEKCNKIEHFEINKLDFIKNSIVGEICHIQLDIKGICNKCKND